MKEKKEKFNEFFEEGLNEILEELRKLMIAKQKDYGPKNILDFGEKGVLVRANDKVARLRNLLWKKDKTPENESIEDSWKDLANYAIIALMLRREKFDRPLKDYD